MAQQALSMVGPKQKLMKLKELIPNATELTCRFGRFLARYLIADEHMPQSFLFGCAYAISDLQIGFNSFAGRSIQGELVKMQPEEYELLRAEIPVIAQAIFPPEFAEEVEDFIRAAGHAVAARNMLKK